MEEMSTDELIAFARKEVQEEKEAQEEGVQEDALQELVGVCTALGLSDEEIVGLAANHSPEFAKDVKETIQGQSNYLRSWYRSMLSAIRRITLR